MGRLSTTECTYLPTYLDAAASGPGTAGAECHRGRPRGVGLALLSWRRVWAWVWAWLRVAVVAR